jgi:carbamoylphosphate synthase small subunit
MENFDALGIHIGDSNIIRSEMQAAGGKAKKLRFRNRGHNVPVLYHQTGECYITPQNQGYHIHCDTLKIVGKFHIQMLTMEVTKVSHMKLDLME